MKFDSFRPCVCALALAAPLFAQTPAAKAPDTETTAAAAGPALVLQTTDAGITRRFASMLGSLGELPEAADGAHYTVALAADGTCKVTTTPGKVELFELTADPGALMDVFAEPIAAYLPLVRGTMTVALQQTGMSAKETAAYVADLLDFPRQLQRITIKVAGDPSKIAEKGLDVQVDVDGAAGSTFARVVEQLRPCSQGAPQLPAGDAAMQVQVSLAPEGMLALMQPFRELSLAMTAHTEQQRARAAALYDRAVAQYDGGLGIVMDGLLGMRAVTGVLDGGTLRELMASEDYVALLAEQRLANRDMEIEVTPDAFEHRGVKFLKTVTSGGPPSPMMPDGSMTMRMAVAGNYLLMAMGGDDAAAEAVVDSILDQKVKRAPLPDAALIDATLDLRRLAKLVLAGTDMAGEPGEGMPSHAAIRVGANGRSLRVKAHVQ